MAKRHLRLVSPPTVNRTVRPRRRPNGDLRTREYLHARRHDPRGYRTAGLELVDLRWDRSSSNG